MATRGPLPQWDIVGDHSENTYEAEDPHGTVWRLWLDQEPAAGDPLPPGYRLAPRDDQSTPAFITAAHGLYRALDEAGTHIAADAVGADPEGAARQLGLNEPEEIHPVLGRMGTSADPSAKEAIRERAENFTHTEPRWKPRTGLRTEKPAEMYTIMRMVGPVTDLDNQDSLTEWADAFLKTDADPKRQNGTES
jgi:hypothetical protein